MRVLSTARSIHPSKESIQLGHRSARSTAISPVLMFAGGLMLISFGAVRLEAGTSGVAESVTLVACIVAGICFLISALISGWLTIRRRKAPH